MKLSKSILRNGAAHSFFAARKKRGGGGGASDNPEPSSPKVTCIGQVRVKSKRKLSKQQTRSLSRRRSAGEISFRKTEQPPRHRHQRWVHLPISALSEFSTCVLFPCCTKTGCCPAPARWLVCGGGRRSDAVSGGGDADEEEVMFVGSLRRHVFEDFEVKNGRIEVKGRRLEVEEEGIHIPPKNALFLMRCGSDPLKMAALMKNRRDNWDDDDIIQEDDDEEEEEEERIHVEKEEIEEIAVSVKLFETNSSSGEEEEEEVESNMSSFETLLDQEIGADRDDVASAETEDYETEEEENRAFEKKNQEALQLPECLLLMMCEPKLSMEVSKETWVRTADFVRWLPERPRKAAAAAAACEHQPVVKRRPSVDSKPRPMTKNDHRLQPPRSSCSLPAPPEPKLQGSACEPLELTRCKSEPMRTAAAKLLPESCSWENGGVQVEPHALGAAGVGF